MFHFIELYKCENSFQNLKIPLTIGPILTLPMEGENFIIYYVSDECHTLCVTAIQGSWEKISHTWLGVANGGVCSQDHATLSL